MIIASSTYVSLATSSVSSFYAYMSTGLTSILVFVATLAVVSIVFSVLFQVVFKTKIG